MFHSNPIPSLCLVACLVHVAAACITVPSRDASENAAVADGGAIWPLKPAQRPDASHTEEGAAACPLDARPEPRASAPEPSGGGAEGPADAAGASPESSQPVEDRAHMGQAGADAGGDRAEPPEVANGPVPDASMASPDDDSPATGEPDLDGGTQPEGAPRPVPAAPGDIVVTEFMADPAERSDTEGEWIELHNPGREALTLAGCTLGEGEPADSVLPDLLLAPGGYATVARGEQPGFVPDAVVGLSLRNSADVVVLQCDGVEIDRIEYDVSAGFPIIAGASATLAPRMLNAVENDAADAWCTSTSAFSADLGTPGAPNDSCTP